VNEQAFRSALQLVLEAIPQAHGVTVKIRRVDRGLSDQLRRAITSVALNLAEADGNRDGNRRLRLESAHGSANEAKAALQVAIAWRYVTREEVGSLLMAIDRVGAMTWSRLRSKP